MQCSAVKCTAQRERERERVFAFCLIFFFLVFALCLSVNLVHLEWICMYVCMGDYISFILYFS